MKALVTGFEPFGGDEENASRTTVLALGEEVVTGILPVEFGAAGDRLLELVRRHRPDVVVCVGEAGLRGRVSVETVAHNLDDARIPDNAGRQPRRTPVSPDAPETLRPQADVEAVAQAIAADGVPVELSDDAGRFVCNHVFFRALNELDVPAVFLHVPAVRSSGTAGVGLETDSGSGPLELPSADELVRAVRAAVRVLSRPGPSGRRA